MAVKQDATQRSSAMMAPANDEVARLGSFSDIRDILRPAAVPAVSGFPAPKPPIELEASVDEGALLAPRVLTADGKHRLVLVLDGRCEVSSAEARVAMSAGDALWVSPNASAELCAAGAARVSIVAFSSSAEVATQTEPVRDAAGRLRELALWLGMELRADFAGADEYRETLLRLMIGEWLRLTSDEMGVLEKRLRAYVLDHLAEPITLEAVARHVGVGRYHLCRKYRRATGQSPMYAVRTVRLEMARELLATTKLPLRVVAKRVGLSSEQHLSRLLRSHFGVGVRDLRPRG